MDMSATITVGGGEKCWPSSFPSVCFAGNSLTTFFLRSSLPDDGRLVTDPTDFGCCIVTLTLLCSDSFRFFAEPLPKRGGQDLRSETVRFRPPLTGAFGAMGTNLLPILLLLAPIVSLGGTEGLLDDKLIGSLGEDSFRAGGEQAVTPDDAAPIALTDWIVR